MMPITSRDRLSFRDSLADTRLSGRQITLLFPTWTECPLPGCGYDELHDSAADPSCAACGGLGRTAVWAAVRVYANVRVVEQSLLTFGQAPPGAQVGDTFLTVDARAKELLDKMYHDKDAYLSIDGKHFRPNSIEVAGVGQVEEYVALLASYKPMAPAAGY